LRFARASRGTIKRPSASRRHIRDFRGDPTRKATGDSRPCIGRDGECPNSVYGASARWPASRCDVPQLRCCRQLWGRPFADRDAIQRDRERREQWAQSTRFVTDFRRRVGIVIAGGSARLAKFCHLTLGSRRENACGGEIVHSRLSWTPNSLRGSGGMDCLTRELQWGVRAHRSRHIAQIFHAIDSERTELMMQMDRKKSTMMQMARKRLRSRGRTMGRRLGVPALPSCMAAWEGLGSFEYSISTAPAKGSCDSRRAMREYVA
jgi:hypothetical protein